MASLSGHLQRVRDRAVAVRDRGAVLLAAVLLAAAPAAAHSTAVHDDRGVRVALSAPPQRIVSLLPALTEMVCALDRCDRLVGVDRYSNHPERVRALPRLGGGIDPSIEAVLASRPDLVLAATSTRGIERLEALGLKVAALEPRNSADVQRVLALLGQLLAVPDAQRVWRTLDAEVEAVARSMPLASRGLTVYYEASAGGYAAGADSFVGELLTRLGLRNIVPAHLGVYPRINPEFVLRADLDIVMVGARNATGLHQRPGWHALRALREDRLCVLTAEQSDILARAGPRMPQAAQLVADCVRRALPTLRRQP